MAVSITGLLACWRRRAAHAALIVASARRFIQRGAGPLATTGLARHGGPLLGRLGRQTVELGCAEKIGYMCLRYPVLVTHGGHGHKVTAPFTTRIFHVDTAQCVAVFASVHAPRVDWSQGRMMVPTSQAMLVVDVRTGQVVRRDVPVLCSGYRVAGVSPAGASVAMAPSGRAPCRSAAGT